MEDTSLKPIVPIYRPTRKARALALLTARWVVPVVTGATLVPCSSGLRSSVGSPSVVTVAGSSTASPGTPWCESSSEAGFHVSTSAMLIPSCSEPLGTSASPWGSPARCARKPRSSTSPTCSVHVCRPRVVARRRPSSSTGCAAGLTRWSATWSKSARAVDGTIWCECSLLAAAADGVAALSRRPVEAPTARDNRRVPSRRTARVQMARPGPRGIEATWRIR